MVLDSQPHHSTLSSQGVFPGGLCPRSPLLMRIPVCWIRAHPNALILTSLQRKTLFPTKFTFTGTGVSTSTNHLKGHNFTLDTDYVPGQVVVTGEKYSLDGVLGNCFPRIDDSAKLKNSWFQAGWDLPADLQPHLSGCCF